MNFCKIIEQPHPSLPHSITVEWITDSQHNKCQGCGSKISAKKVDCRTYTYRPNPPRGSQVTKYLETGNYEIELKGQIHYGITVKYKETFEFRHRYLTPTYTCRFKCFKCYCLYEISRSKNPKPADHTVFSRIRMFFKTLRGYL